jgi:hypothetical protein
LLGQSLPLGGLWCRVFGGSNCLLRNRLYLLDLVLSRLFCLPH